jgi:hypothetical protein
MTERHFRVVQLEGKKVEIGGVSVSSKASPGSAARKLLTSIAHHKGLKKNKKASMPKVKFCIQEYTQGSSKKVYGPYVGHYHKYTAAELKKAMTADGKVKFTMKPVVKLVKGKNMKGGAQFNFNEKLKNFRNKFASSYSLIPKSELYYLVKEINGDNVTLSCVSCSQNKDLTIKKENIKKGKNVENWNWNTNKLKIGDVIKWSITKGYEYTDNPSYLNVRMYGRQGEKGIYYQNKKNKSKKYNRLYGAHTKDFKMVITNSNDKHYNENLRPVEKNNILNGYENPFYKNSWSWF